MKYRSFLVILFLLLTLSITAENPQNQFDAKRFQTDLEAFITQEVALTPKESARFFPLYREMMEKQRALFNKGKAYRHIKPSNEAACRKAIQEKDNIELQIKKLQQQYHNKFLKVISASKLYEVMKAEDKFHRQAFTRATSKRKHANKR